MVDLVVARTLRILAMSAESNLWQAWIAGHDEILELLEARRRPPRGRPLPADLCGLSRKQVEPELFAE